MLDMASFSIHADEAVWFRLGLFSKEQGNLPKAKAAFEKALSINSNSSEVHYNIGKVFYESGDYDESFYHACRVIETSPLNDDAYVLAGNSLIKKGDIKRGQKYLDEAHLLNPYCTSI